MARCPWCKRKVKKLVRHHLDYHTNLSILICENCHYQQHFPDGKNSRRVVLSKKAKVHISVIKQLRDTAISTWRRTWIRGRR